MRKINFDQMEIISAGGKDRDCMLVGGLIVIAVLTGNVPTALSLTAGAIYHGCFD